MAEVTNADGEKARAVWHGRSWRDFPLTPSDRERIERFAAALAEEREKARAPFLALAEEYERHAGLMQAGIDSGALPDVVMRSQAFLDAAASIRKAAERDGEL